MPVWSRQPTTPGAGGPAGEIWEPWLHQSQLGNGNF